MKILVVEDDQGITEFYQEVLPVEGHSALYADNGKKALELVTQACDLILLDIRLPDMDGVEVCRRIRAMDVRVPVCMVTVELDPAVVEDSFAAGANGYIVKPFDIEELRQKIEELSSPLE